MGGGSHGAGRGGHGLSRRCLPGRNSEPGTTVAVIGLGGLGSYGAQIAKLLGAAPVIAIDTDPVAVEQCHGSRGGRRPRGHPR